MHTMKEPRKGEVRSGLGAHTLNKYDHVIDVCLPMDVQQAGGWAMSRGRRHAVAGAAHAVAGGAQARIHDVRWRTMKVVIDCCAIVPFHVRSIGRINTESLA